MEPNLVWFELPFADRLSSASREGLAEVLECLGARVKKFPSPRSFAGVVHHQQVIHEYEMARALHAEVDDHWHLISDSLKPALQRGLARSDDEYAQSHTHHQQVIHEYEIARALQSEVDEHWDSISESLKPALQRGLARSDDEYAQALAMMQTMEAFYTEVFNEYDAIVAQTRRRS